MSLGFLLFLLLLWLFLKGGTTRSFLEGLIAGPLALMQILLAVSSVGLFIAMPLAGALLERRWDTMALRDAGLALAGAAVSLLVMGIPFLLKTGYSQGFHIGAYPWSAMGLYQRPLSSFWGL